LEQAQAVSLTEATPKADAVLVPKPRPVAFAVEETPQQPKTVTRLSSSDARNWGINVGSFPSRYAAEKMLLKTALAEIDTLDGSLRKVQAGKRGFEANFLGLSQDRAAQACKRLQARDVNCTPIDPS